MGAVLAVAALASPAAAHDHRVPKPALEVADGVQRGTLVESTWLRGSRDGGCTVEFTDGFGWPAPLRSRAGGSTAALLLRKPESPVELELLAGWEEDAQGEPRALVPWPFVLRPRSGSWELVVPLPASEHVFFQLEASWTDEDGCGGTPDLGDQYGVWRFHVERREMRSHACGRRRVEALVRDFVRAYNRGDSEALERMWAQEPEFRWYFVQDERVGSDAERRSTLGAYFSARHALNDRIDLRRLHVRPRSEDGTFGISFRLRRSSEQRDATGFWHGKGSAQAAEPLPGIFPFSSASTCALIVWSMGKE